MQINHVPLENPDQSAASCQQPKAICGIQENVYTISIHCLRFADASMKLERACLCARCSLSVAARRTASKRSEVEIVHSSKDFRVDSNEIN